MGSLSLKRGERDLDAKSVTISKMVTSRVSKHNCENVILWRSSFRIAYKKALTTEEAARTPSLNSDHNTETELDVFLSYKLCNI